MPADLKQTFKTPAQDAVKLNSERFTDPQKQVNLVPETNPAPNLDPAEQDVRSAKCNVHFGTFNLKEETGSIADKLVQLITTALAASSFIGKNGFGEFLKALEEILRPIFFPMKFDVIVTEQFPVSRTAPQNGEGMAFVSIDISAIVLGGASDGVPWYFEAEVLPDNGEKVFVRLDSVAAKTMGNTLAGRTVTRIDADEKHTTVAVLKVHASLPSLGSFWGGSGEKVKELLKSADLMESGGQGKPDQVKPPKPPAQGQTPDQADPGWYAGWTKFKTEFANAVSKFLKEEFANLKVTDFKLSYKIVTDRVGAELLRKVKEQNDQHLHMAEEWEKSEKKLLGESGTESGQEGGSSGTGDVPPGSSGASSTPRGGVFTLPRFPFIPVSVPADFVQDAGPSVAEGSSGSGKASVPPPDRTNISPAPAEVMDASSSALEARRQERTQAGGLAEKRRRW